ncbi:MAG: nucleotidyltransferase family protein [Paracoccaceae bacterium]
MTAGSPELHILILAAGAARRMRGTDKLLEIVNQRPMLRHITEVALETGRPVVVTLPPDRPLRNAAIEGLAAVSICVAQPGEGMAASLRAGVAAIPEHAAVLLLLADLPDITAADLRFMAAAYMLEPSMILRATAASGTPGHPVVFPPWVRSDLLGLTGDDGARGLLQTNPDRVKLVALPDQHATTDLDTPEAWAEWRARGL